jgi:hypothetical protein
MAREKQQQNDKPSWHDIRSKAEPRQAQEMDLINREFGFGTFTGRIVTNWCGICGKWRIHFVSSMRPTTIGGFEPTDENFKCTKCGKDLPLILDDKHTILRNV